jgi:DNA polymerase I
MLQNFTNIWCVDFEFMADSGENPEPVCLVAHELLSGRIIRQWRDEFGAAPPYPIDNKSLFVAYYASAELGCHLALGWPMPERILDLFCEFRNHTNGISLKSGSGLIGALVHYGLDSIGSEEKEGMRDLILSGGPWSTEEREGILDYCESDVAATSRLLNKMADDIDLPRALLRGRYMAAAARMERHGVPIDISTLMALQKHWKRIQAQLITEVDKDYNCFDGGTFKMARFAEYIERENISWKRLKTGKLDLKEETFAEAAKTYPRIRPLHELRVTLGQMRLSAIAVGKDSRNRTLLSAFAARTGRNQPSNTKSIFGPAVWLRSLIQPPEGFGLSYIDWSQQEFGIAASLSGDPAMLTAYDSGDPYLAFAKMAGAIPPDGTKATHGDVRELYKTCILAVQYGMEAESLSRRIAKPYIIAHNLLRQHRESFPVFWRWLNTWRDKVNLNGVANTVFGWRFKVAANFNPRMLQNFPMQANGAEMLRIACCLATEAGVEVCAPVHDALLIAAPLSQLGAAITLTKDCMGQASEAVLGGFRLRCDSQPIPYPNRYSDPRGEEMWEKIQRLLGDCHGGQ